MSIYDVSHLNIHNLVRCLWKHAKRSHFTQDWSGFGASDPSEISNADIDVALKERDQYLDYLCGRCLKINFRDMKSVNSTSYDRENSIQYNGQAREGYSDPFGKVLEEMKFMKQ